MKRLLFILPLTLLGFVVRSQDNRVDSLNHLYNLVMDSTIRDIDIMISYQSLIPSIEAMYEKSRNKAYLKQINQILSVIAKHRKKVRSFDEKMIEINALIKEQEILRTYDTNTIRRNNNLRLGLPSIMGILLISDEQRV